MINQLLAIEYNRIQFRIQYNDSIKCEFYCITFIEYMLKGKNLLDYTLKKNIASIKFRVKMKQEIIC